jgi:CBS domain containing-hemolysin-like protein
MSDTITPTTSSATDAREGFDGRGEGEGRSSESWIDRLMMAVGWKQSSATLRDNLQSVLEQDGDAAFSTQERAMIRNILRLRETRVRDVMVPRSEIDAVANDVTLTELMILFKDSGHSRMPVYKDTLDDAGGMIHIRDLMGYIAEAALVRTSRLETGAEEARDIDLAQVDLSRTLAETGLERPVLFVPGSMPATDLLARMQQNRIQMALVIDEFGGVDGLASLEDIVETVVGDIEDEHDTDEDEAVVVADGDAWIADGRVELADMAEASGINFEIWDVSEDVDTLGGLVVALVGRVPLPGETIRTEAVPGIVFDVLDADPRRVKKLRIQREPDNANDRLPQPIREAGAA